MRYISFIFCFLYSTVLFSQEVVEFRGTGRTGHYDETGLLKKWPDTGPEVIMKIEGIGKGFSQPVCAEDKIFVTGIKKDTIDILSAYDFDGRLLWETPYGRSWIRTYPDSRSTPTYQNGKLFVSSGTGQLICISASTGEVLWNVDAVDKYGGMVHKHGDAECPLIAGDLVVYAVGGEQNAMVAFDKNNGSMVWTTESLGGAKSYSSPVLINHNGFNIILLLTTDDLIAVNPADGKIFWSYDMKQYHLLEQGSGAHTNPPLYHDGHVLIASGYDHPAVKLLISRDGKSVYLVWKNDIMDTHLGGMVLAGGNIYSSNWQHNTRGKWVSVNWETGATNWETQWHNKGSVICADGLIYIFDEKEGNVALVEPSPENMKIISTFRVTDGEGPYWAHPAIYNKKLFIRHGNVLMIYNLEA
ncbi:MAG: PQQ-like beta-propeller repeat protein [Prolixibacteraceae bacterium]|nr:PQQ-like beta-propeller repeat protein [Prolixibacteraceae bacterium]